MKEEKKSCEACSICGEFYTEDKLVELDGKKICPECLSRETIVCSHCGERIRSMDHSGTLSMTLCSAYYISLLRFAKTSTIYNTTFNPIM